MYFFTCNTVHGFHLLIIILFFISGFKKRAPRAIKEIRKFAEKTMGTPDVRVEMGLNKQIWSRGIRYVHFIWAKVSYYELYSSFSLTGTIMLPEQRLKRLHLACLVSCIDKISCPILIELEFELERSRFGKVLQLPGLTIMPHVI